MRQNWLDPTCYCHRNIHRAFCAIHFERGRRGCVMPQLVDILLFTVLSYGTQSLAASRKHHAALVASWKTVDVNIQKVLLDAMVLSGRFYCYCQSCPTSPRLRNSCQRLFGFSPSARQRSTTRPNLEWPFFLLKYVYSCVTFSSLKIEFISQRLPPTPQMR